MTVRGGEITAVEPGSVGEAAGLQPGDRLLSIDGQALRDVVDVQFYGAEEVLELTFEREGESFRVEMERDYDQPLGLTFRHPTFDRGVRRCANNCDFCFVKQNAPGMRRSLYVKDDDYRYSFLFGNFVTLTNLTDDDWARLEEQRLSPLYVSVHATEPELRQCFLGRREPTGIVEQLRRLAGLGIQVHTQVVLVPGLNDGEHLAHTVSELMALYGKPVLSLSVVPIGLTRFHRGSCRPFTLEESRALLDQVEPWRVESRARRKCTFVYPSDEWYLVAGRALPPAAEYDGFPQVENGVGMVRLLLDEWAAVGQEGSRCLAPPTCQAPIGPATLVCGTLIAPVLGRIIEEWNALAGASLHLVPVVNGFFGTVTTVSGLLTGRDVVAALKSRPLGEMVLLPRAMFTGRYGAGDAPPGTTLDGMSIDEIEAQLGVRVAMAGTLAEALAALQVPGA